MQVERSLESALGDVLWARAPPRLRQEIQAEVEVLIARYAPGQAGADLLAAAEALQPAADLPGPCRTRLRLWSAALRQRAAEVFANANPAAGP